MNNRSEMNTINEKCKAPSLLFLQDVSCFTRSNCLFEEEELEPLPIYTTDDPLAPRRMCRSVAFNLLPKCKYCGVVETSYLPLPRSSFGISCLDCYKKFRIGYMSMIAATCQVDTTELREQFITEFKTRTKL